MIFTKIPNYAPPFIPEPDDPAATRHLGAGSFSSGRDVFIVVTFVNGHGESSRSGPSGLRVLLSMTSSW